MNDASEPDPVNQTEIDSRALLKVSAAARHFAALEREAHKWFIEAGPFDVPIRTMPEDPSCVQICFPQSYNPPQADWESRFSDGAHNLRAALDILTIELAHITGVPPARERSVYFPILDSNGSKDWQASTKSLGTVPRSILKRMRDVQDDASPPLITPNYLETLSAIDNDDKHRFGVEIYTIPIYGTAQTLFLVDESDDSLWIEPWLTLNFDSAAEIPAQVARLGDIMPFVSVRGRIGHLLDVQKALVDDTQRVVNYIATGEWPEQRTFERGLPSVDLLVSVAMPNLRRQAALLPRTSVAEGASGAAQRSL